MLVLDLKRGRSSIEAGSIISLTSASPVRSQRERPGRGTRRIIGGEAGHYADDTGAGCFVGRVNKPAATGTVTFAKDVAGIFNKHCVECHRPGEIGPFSLTWFDEAIGWADTIGEVVREGGCPRGMPIRSTATSPMTAG